MLRFDGRPPLAFQSGHEIVGHELLLALSGDGRTLAAAVAMRVGGDYRVRIWDLTTGNETTNFNAHVDYVSFISFSADDLHLLTTSYDKTAEVRERATWRRVAQVRMDVSLAHPTLLPQAGLLLSGGPAGFVQARELKSEDPMRGKRPLILASEIISEARGGIAPDGSALAALRTNGTGILIDTRGDRANREISLPVSGVRQIAVGPKGRLLAVDAADGLSLWEAEGKLVTRLSPPTSKALARLALSPDEGWLAGVGQDRSFHLWSLKPSVKKCVWNLATQDVVAVQFSPDSSLIALSHRSGSNSVWNLSSNTMSVKLAGHTRSINCLAFSPDGRRLASTSLDHTVRVWDLATSREIARFGGSRSSYYRVAFSPDGQRVLVNEWGESLVFDIKTDRQVARLPTFTPLFLDEDTVLGLSEKETWYWRPPSLKEIDALLARTRR